MDKLGQKWPAAFGAYPVMMVLILLVIFGPANLFAYFKSPSLYTILLGIVLTYYIISKTMKG